MTQANEGGSTRPKPDRRLMPPLMPVALAMAAGIVMDRYFEPCGTLSWTILALAGTLVAGLCWRWPTPATAGLLLAFAGLGGGWHHHHWSDLPADDLARTASDLPRPAWIRGEIREVQGTRPGDTVTTRGAGPDGDQ
ncbi:hypothetical protein [Singulisphaera sp. PoT]|uniref:hypothetical protein n=1 Tax=Singulisphaera sp. PoT TaxID=3411797 RepID=UPI003BF53656